jgi:hypothetical protein
MRRYGDTTYRVRAALRSWAQVQAVPTKISSALQPFSLFFHRAALALRPTAEEEKQNEVEIAKCKIDGGFLSEIKSRAVTVTEERWDGRRLVA